MTFNPRGNAPRIASLVTAAAAGALVLGHAGAAHADRRAFGYTYEYNTMAAGGLDLELWNTQSRTTFDGGAAGLEWKAELEYGITDHWDIALYQVFAQGGTEGAVAYDETTVETRYRFAERGQWPVDVLVYFELAKGFGVTKWDVEPKLVLARDLGKLSLNLNLTPELEIAKHREAGATEAELEAELEPEWAFGATYEVSPRWKVGGETFGALDLEESEVTAYAGPALSWSPSAKLGVATTAAFGLTDGADAFALRFVLGIGM